MQLPAGSPENTSETAGTGWGTVGKQRGSEHGEHAGKLTPNVKTCCFREEKEK